MTAKGNSYGYEHATLDWLDTEGFQIDNELSL